MKNEQISNGKERAKKFQNTSKSKAVLNTNYDDFHSHFSVQQIAVSRCRCAVQVVALIYNHEHAQPRGATAEAEPRT